MKAFLVFKVENLPKVGDEIYSLNRCTISSWFALIKNGKGVWDQNVRMAENSHGSGEKKLHPLFISSKGEKRFFGKSVWRREGLEYFYTVERNWKKVYTKKTFSDYAVNGSIWSQLINS
jgi:hypothetical protein